MAARYETWVFGRLLLGIAGSKPSGGMNFVTCGRCVLRGKRSVTCRSLVQRSPDECVVSLNVIWKPDLGLSVLRSVLQSFRPSSCSGASRWYLICQYLLFNILRFAFMFAICGDFETNGIHFEEHFLTPMSCSYRMGRVAIQGPQRWM